MDTADMFSGPTTPDLEWPTWVVYSAIPLGSSLMCFRFLQVAVSFLKTGELPHHDHGHVDGLEEEEIPEEVQNLAVEGKLHSHERTHEKRHADDRSGNGDQKQ
uniref:TRAP transporter small permease n=1 Tax=Accumulibacter sp. TaxID=2053492 RepID=UPI0035AD9C44